MLTGTGPGPGPVSSVGGDRWVFRVRDLGFGGSVSGLGAVDVWTCFVGFGATCRLQDVARDMWTKQVDRREKVPEQRVYLVPWPNL